MWFYRFKLWSSTNIYGSSNFSSSKLNYSSTTFKDFFFSLDFSLDFSLAARHLVVNFSRGEPSEKLENIVLLNLTLDTFL